MSEKKENSPLCLSESTPANPSLVPVYEQKQIQAFWSDTDESTKNTVVKRARSESTIVDRQAIQKKFSKVEKRCLSDASSLELEALLQQYLDEARDRQAKDHTDSRLSKRTSRQLTRFLNVFHGHAQAYSGVVQLMNGAGPGYGDAAYGALSLFLVVAVRRQQTNDLIANMLLTLQQQYYRIQMTKDAYATARMKEHTAVVYQLGIEFLYEAVRYYSIGSFRRLCSFLMPPPSVGLDKKVAEIHVAIEEVRREMEVLDGIRLKEVERKLESVEESVQALHNRNDHARLETLEQMLNMDPASLKNTVSQYSHELSSVFDNLPRLPPLDVERGVFETERFKQWHNSIQSSLFILYGRTVAPERTSLSWLSPAAVCLVTGDRNARSNEAHTLVYCFCQTQDDYQDGDLKRFSASTLLSQMTFQLLEKQLAQPLLRDDQRYTTIQREVKKINSLPDSKMRDRLNSQFALLSRLLHDCDLQKLTIVVDRADRIQGIMENFLEPILDMMEKSQIIMKVFVTIRTQYFFEDSFVKDKVNKVKYTGLAIDQDD